MAITDIAAFAHLTDADIENLAFELDAIRFDIEDSLGERDARDIRRTIAAQRVLDVAGRIMLAASSKRSAWWAGTLTLALAKIIENMEIGHNVMHGQWNCSAAFRVVVGAAFTVPVADLGDRGHVDGVVDAPVAAQRQPAAFPPSRGHPRPGQCR